MKKLQKGPLTLPSPVTPRREEGKDLKIREEIPSLSTGEGQGGGDNGIFSHLQGGRGDSRDCAWPQAKLILLVAALAGCGVLKLTPPGKPSPVGDWVTFPHARGGGPCT